MVETETVREKLKQIVTELDSDRLNNLEFELEQLTMQTPTMLLEMSEGEVSDTVRGLCVRYWVQFFGDINDSKSVKAFGLLKDHNSDFIRIGFWTGMHEKCFETARNTGYVNYFQSALTNGLYGKDYLVVKNLYRRFQEWKYYRDAMLDL